MSTHRSTWKRRERDAARFFGAERQPLSGSCGGRTGSDSTHDRLYIECKTRASSAVRNLWETTRDKARKEGKTPVVMLFDKGKHGPLVVVHQDDLAAVAAEWAAQSPSEVQEARAGALGTGARPITDPRPPGQSGPGALETPR